MNNYRINAMSSTLPSAIAASIFLAGLGMGIAQAQEVPAGRTLLAPESVYFSDGLRFAQAARAMQTPLSAHDDHFLNEVSGFYARLLAEQKPLDPEFAALLSEDLWDLYAD